MTMAAFYETVREAMGQADREAVERGVAAVLGALRDRLTTDEAWQAAAQLPQPLKAMWLAGEAAGRKPQKMHRPEFYERIRKEAGLPSTREARLLAAAVFAALKQQLSPGEADDVEAQLPRDLKETWADA